MLCKATEDTWVMVENSDKIHRRKDWQTTSTFLLREPHEQYDKSKTYDTESWTPQLVGT